VLDGCVVPIEEMAGIAERKHHSHAH
jgi:hypothetical protein